LHAATVFGIWFPSRSARSSKPITFTKNSPIDPEQLARFIAHAAADKKAEDVVAIDLRGISSFTDFFVICSGTSEPHLKAIAGEIHERAKKEHGAKPMAVDGYPVSQWIVADYTDVVVHIFNAEKRAFYSLEDLWSDAPRLKLEL
jgi:ribosome-associated protein